MLAVIQTGSKQFLVEPGRTIRAELLGTESDSIEFEPLLVIDGDNVHIGSPKVAGAKVIADIAPEEFKDDKVRVLKYKAKKRQSTMRGHRQRYSLVTIKTISAK